MKSVVQSPTQESRQPARSAVRRLLVSTMPRSGTRFVTRVLADVFHLKEIPCKFTAGRVAAPPDWDPYRLDQTFSCLEDGQCVIAHMPRTSAVLQFAECPNNLVVYLYRDPRDVCVSAVALIKHKAAHHPFHKLFRSLPDSECISLMLCGFRLPVSQLSQLPAEPHCGYIEFAGMQYFTSEIDGWLSTPGIAHARFEDLIESPATVLEEALKRAGAVVHRDALEEACAKHAFEQQTGGRQRGIEDPNSHYRKGVAGDWSQHFNASHRALAKRVIGDELVRLGYENDMIW